MQRKNSNTEVLELTPRELLIKQAVEDPVAYLRQAGLTLYEFLQLFWEEVTPDPLVLNWHIKLLCDELQTLAERVARGNVKLYDLIINVPPGSTKTIICLIMFPAWCWTRWYWMQFVTGSHSMPIALKSATKCRDLFRSQKYKALYPELAMKEDENSKSDFRVIKKEYYAIGRVPRIRHGGGRFTTAVEASVTGTHAHIILLDDIIDPKGVMSQAAIDEANRFMSETMSTRKINKETTPTVLIMQRLHQNDPTGYWLGRKKNVKHICLPGEVVNFAKYVKPQELIQNYTTDGLLDKVRLPWTVLREMEADLGQYGYAGQVGQNPVPPGGGMFKVDHFQIIDRLPSDVNFVETVRCWDKAASDGKGCYTAGVKMSSLVNKHFIIEDVKRGQWATEERESIIKETAQADGTDVSVYVEQEPGSGGKESAEGTIRNLAGFNAGADLPKGDKPTRADPFSVQVNWGNVMLLRGEWNQAFIEECRFFPFGTYKDQVDAASSAFSHLVSTDEARVIGGGRRR